MVPTTPYHSYSAAVATNGTVTGNVVQETTMYTVVPMVSEPGAHPVDPNFCLDSDLLSF